MKSLPRLVPAFEADAGCSCAIVASESSDGSDIRTSIDKVPTPSSSTSIAGFRASKPARMSVGNSPSCWAHVQQPNEYEERRIRTWKRTMTSRSHAIAASASEFCVSFSHQWATQRIGGTITNLQDVHEHRFHRVKALRVGQSATK